MEKRFVQFLCAMCVCVWVCVWYFGVCDILVCVIFNLPWVLVCINSLLFLLYTHPLTQPSFHNIRKPQQMNALNRLTFSFSRSIENLHWLDLVAVELLMPFMLLHTVADHWLFVPHLHILLTIHWFSHKQLQPLLMYFIFMLLCAANASMTLIIILSAPNYNE